jgi:hypothetical protein
MISKMRAFTPVIMWIVIVTFVGTIFFAWGMDFAGIGKKNIAGTINGVQIPLDYFDRRVTQERDRLQKNFQGQDVPAYQYSLAPRQVWEQEVSQYLSKKVIQDMKLGATADEVFEHLKNNPPPGIDTSSYFQTNGTFDTSKYVAFLNNPASYDNPALLELESYTQKSVIPMQKLEVLLRAGDQPSKAEVAREYRLENEKVVFAWAFAGLPAFPVGGAEVTKEAIAGYYQAHQDSFKVDDMADLYYVKFEKKPTPNDEKVSMDEMVELKNRIKSREITFDEAARNESDDQGSASKGGDLGWFGKGAMVPAFEAVAFGLDTGIISDPVKTQFGYHLIRVDAREKKGDTIRVHARHILRKIYATVETIDSLKEYADSLRERALTEGFLSAVKGKAYIFDSTGLFKRGDILQGIGFISGVSRFAFDNPIGAVAEQTYDTKDAIYVFSVKRKVRKGILSLEDAQPKIIRVLTDSLQHKKAEAYLAAAIAKSGSGESLASLGKADSLIHSGVSDTVNHLTFVPPVGGSNAATSAAFSLPLNTTSGVVKVDGGYCVVHPVWRSTVDVIPWGTPPVQVARQTVAQAQQQQLYADWYKSSKKSLHVTSFIDKYYLQ